MLHFYDLHQNIKGILQNNKSQNFSIGRTTLNIHLPDYSYWKVSQFIKTRFL